MTGQHAQSRKPRAAFGPRAAQPAGAVALPEPEPAPGPVTGHLAPPPHGRVLPLFPVPVGSDPVDGEDTLPCYVCGHPVVPIRWPNCTGPFPLCADIAACTERARERHHAAGEPEPQSPGTTTAEPEPQPEPQPEAAPEAEPEPEAAQDAEPATRRRGAAKPGEPS